MATATDGQQKPERYSSWIDGDVLAWLRERGRRHDWTVSHQIRRILRAAMEAAQGSERRAS